MPQIVEFNGKNIEFPDGMAATEIEAALKQNALSVINEPPAKRSFFEGVKRQAGLTARNTLDGLASTADMVALPITAPLGMFGVKPRSISQSAADLSDSMGFAKPEDGVERVSSEAMKLLAGGGGLLGGLRGVANISTGAAKAIAPLLANPTQQLTSAVGAGLAGGGANEAGGGTGTQVGASVAGGLLGALSPSGLMSSGNSIRNAIKPTASNADIDIKISQILDRSGVSFADLAGNVKNGLRNELRGAIELGKDLSPDAVRRLADFKTVGAQPTRGMLSLDPVQITREMNLAKIGANSNNNQLQGLAGIQNSNNAKIIDSLNSVGASANANPIVAGQLVRDRVQGQAAALQSAEQSAWDSAKLMPGYKQPIFPDGLNAANKALGEEALMPYMPKQISEYMAAFQTGQQPFTPQAYKNLQSMLSNTMRQGGNEAAAAGVARKALDSVPMRPLTETGRDIGIAPVTGEMAAMLRNSDAAPQAAIDAVNAARGATAAKYKYQDSSPLVRSVLSDARSADPEKIAQSFIINGSLNDAKQIAKEVGTNGLNTMREAIASHIKNKAISGAADETGKVSQSAFNRAIKDIGDEKLALFFSKEEISQLKASGRVASYMQNQPVGSAVNNSNSGALMLGRGADFLDALARKAPFGAQMFADPLRDINVSLTQRSAQKILPGLLAEQEKRRLLPSLLLPGLAASNGLLAE